ncbi:hypothetical protein DRQ09_07375, partial [candidate division KSB1 bacterium]
MKAITVFLFLLLSTMIDSGGKSEPVRYRLNVFIEPERGKISVKGSVLIKTSAVDLREISFDIHKTFNIKKLLIDGEKVKFHQKNIKANPLMPA